MAEATDFIGRELPTQHVVVERGPVGNFATAVTDRNPVFHDARAAADAGFERVPAPPTFNFVMHTFGAFAELQPEQPELGNPVAEVIATMMAGGGMILHGEQAFSWRRPVLVGDELTSSGRIEDVQVKASGEVTMTVVTVSTVWSDPSGDEVCRSTMTLLHRR